MELALGTPAVCNVTDSAQTASQGHAERQQETLRNPIFKCARSCFAYFPHIFAPDLLKQPAHMDAKSPKRSKQDPQMEYLKLIGEDNRSKTDSVLIADDGTRFPCHSQVQS